MPDFPARRRWNMQLRFLVFLMAVIGILVGNSALFSSVASLNPFDTYAMGFVGVKEPRLDTQPVGDDAAVQCEEPTSPLELSCDMQVRRILASVVRYEFFIPEYDGSDRLISSLGHGTVKDGRYLVVHNHFGVDLVVFETGAQDALLGMHNGLGDLFLWEQKPRFAVVVEEVEALVLDFGVDDDGQGFFESKGIQSATYENWQLKEPQPGQSVAQVVWDGSRSDITWTSIKEVILDNGVPRIVLANPLRHGASGGGVFLDGSHIAVNWERGKHLDENGAVIEEFSTAALNSSALVDTVRNPSF
jgi:hypothetical protein